MPDFEIVSLHEAQFRTISRRQGKFLNQYADYIHQLSSRQAGKLSPVGKEKPATIRRRLQAAATALGTKLIIKRSGENIYFWSEDRGDEQPKTKRSYTRRMRSEEQTTVPDQPFKEPEEFEQAVSEQTSVSDAI
jgi:hypothetical protein